MKKTLLDASSAILLHKADLLDALIGVYQVFVTPSVLQELVCKEYPGADIFLCNISLNTIQVIDNENVPSDRKVCLKTTKSLDQGELDTIMCLTAGKGDFIITDDGRAARYCKKNGLPFINALLFPRLMYFAGLISLQESNIKMDAIIRIGRYSPQITAWAYNCSEESLAFAIPGAVAY